MNSEKKLGILVGEDNWSFFKEIFEDMDMHFETDVYRSRTFNTPLLYGRLNRWAYRRDIQSILGRNDICFFEWASDLLMHASQMPKRSAVVTRMHSFELYQWASYINWEFVDKVILVSEAMRQKFSHQFPDHAHKAEVIYNGVSYSEFKPPEERIFNFDIGMLCSISPVKRVYETILMIHGLREQGFDAHLHIAGAPKGDLRYAAASERLVEKLGLEDVVRFYGHVFDTASWLRNIDIYISNSYWEGHQVALIEAMATGRFCLSHFWDGSEEALPEENIFVTETELLQKIIEYARQSEKERERKRALLRTIACEKFDIKQTILEFRRSIEEAAENSTKRA